MEWPSILNFQLKGEGKGGQICEGNQRKQDDIQTPFLA